MTKRQSVNFPGFAHQNPIPNASRIGNLMMSSVISGVDPGTRNLPADLAGQVRNLFTHIGRAVEAAGGTPDNILKITFWMKEPGTGRCVLDHIALFEDRFSQAIGLGPIFGRPRRFPLIHKRGDMRRHKVLHERKQIQTQKICRLTDFL